MSIDEPAAPGHFGQIVESALRDKATGDLLPAPEIDEHRAQALEDYIKGFMQLLGLDGSDPHLRDTPRRVAAMYRDELFNCEPFAFTTFAAETTGMVVMRDIEFVSVCSHHLVPFMGKAHIAYIPKKRMAGLSKLARAVDFFARRPQVQERMTDQIADFLEHELDPVGVGVVLEAEHLCMAIRGARKQGVLTTTSALRGALMEQGDARAEYYALIYGGNRP